MGQRRLQDDIVATFTAARAAEREVIGTLPEEVLLAPGPDGAWSPKDIQARLPQARRQPGRSRRRRR